MLFFTVQFVTVVAIGGLMGWIFGSIFHRFNVMPIFLLPVLEYLQWIPFLITWSLPIWPPRQPYVYTFIILIWLLCCLAVLVATFRQHLVLRTILNLDWSTARLHLVRHTVLTSFFICLISQIWLQPYGWQWFAMYEPNGMGRLAIHLLVLVGWLTILQLLLRANFREAADVSRSLLTKHLALEPAFSASGLLLTFGFCFLAWFLLGKFLNDLFGLPPVIDVLIQIIAIFSSFDTVGYPFIVSLAEVLVGACFAACLILLLTNFASRRLKVGQAIEVLIPYMFAIPVLASLFLLGWPIPLRITFGVVLISVFPCMQVMWRAVNDIGYRVIPIAISEALPFAFVGMIFGEAMFSTNGAYLLIIQARSHSETSIRAVGFAVLVFVSFVVLSYLFRRIGNRMAMSGVAFASRADVVA